MHDMYKIVEIFTNLFLKLDDIVYSHNFVMDCVKFYLFVRETCFISGIYT